MRETVLVNASWRSSSDKAVTVAVTGQLQLLDSSRQWRCSCKKHLIYYMDQMKAVNDRAEDNTQDQNSEHLKVGNNIRSFRTEIRGKDLFI